MREPVRQLFPRTLPWRRTRFGEGLRAAPAGAKRPRNHFVEYLLRRLALRARKPEQRIIVYGLYRREVPMSDILRPRRSANEVRDRIERQINDLARIRRDVAGRAVHQIAVEHEHAAGLAGWRDDTAFVYESRHGLFVECPQRIRGGLEVVRGLEIAGVLAFRHQHQRAIDRHHLVQEYRDVHRAWLRHPVVSLPGAVVLMPLPDVAGESRFGVDLVLVHVDLLAKDLFNRIDHARMRSEQPECFVVEM